MRIGFTMPQYGPVANRPAELVRFAAEAERLGADALWVGDRLLSPLEPKVGYGMAGRARSRRSSRRCSTRSRR